jgi:prolyl-tRNA editing enzyme YbaK/EbsC (Cys-tRNA(Pro) deacylase)
MHPNARHVAERLRELNATGQIRELPAPAPTAASAAAQLGCDVGAIANSLIFSVRRDAQPLLTGSADGEPLLVLTSGAHRVNTARIAELIGATAVTRADPEFVRAATGQPIGGVAPIGHPRPIRTLVDEWLAKHEVVWAAAGHPHTVFPTSHDELLRITGGTVVQVE